VSHKLSPLMGLVFFASLLAAILTGYNKGNDVGGARVLAFYSAHHDRLIVSSILTLIAVFSGMIFFGVLRDHLRQGDAVRGLTATAFGGVVLFAASGGLAAGAVFALADVTSSLAPATAQTLNVVAQDGTNGLAGAGISVLLFCYGLAIIRTGLLPKWLGWVALPFAVIGVVMPLSWLAFIGCGFWTLIASVALYLRKSKVATTSAPVSATA
jgi:hypothetical protein